ncbi:MAG: primosomal protein N' [Parasporobacterium sp.]|nr:primosomal protein N' [Parasporobacterium sp.]
MKYADVIVDISHENVDRPFEYIVPSELEASLRCGCQVVIPFGKGNKQIQGFVINIKEEPTFDVNRLKAIESILPGSRRIESHMIELAAYIRENYGSTMNKALKIVLPVRKKSSPIVEKYISCSPDRQKVEEALERYRSDKRMVARCRLLEEAAKEKVLPYNIVRDKLNISVQTIRSLEKEGLIRIDIMENLRDAFQIKEQLPYTIRLNPDQLGIADDIWERYQAQDLRPSLIRGITGSGKTEIYIELIDRMIRQGKQAIVLIPEIALTYQTVLRFYKKFGDRISVINSRLTAAQKHDQLEKARRHEVDIIIGPRSALFTPFDHLGIIIIDEEHESTYKNENAPRYHSREVAVKLAQMSGGIVVLGSATPSVESYYKAKNGIYQLYSLDKRAKGKGLPEVSIVDLRQELASGNRSIISRKLDELIRDRLERKEQIILFINRRAYQSFVSCRSCGAPVQCPHCDVSLKYHRNGKLICHYCGYEMPMVRVCPSCGSKYIGTFGAGTQKVEEEVNRLYPEAMTLRMDMDTTREKDGHEKILSAFANREADILVGTQMIVKGHDFPDVTLVGILAADISLYSGSYLSAERTFQLITQASGRAGRGARQGNVIIQTYSPENYAVQMGASQDYPQFYEHEMSYRKLLGYPPSMNMLGIFAASKDERLLQESMEQISRMVDQKIREGLNVIRIGPSAAPIARIQDQYRKILYIKAPDYADLTRIKDLMEEMAEQFPDKGLSLIYDFSLNAN